MQLFVSFDEVGEYVMAHYGQKVSLDMVSDKEVKVRYSPKVGSLSLPVPVSVNLRFEEVRPDSLTVVCSGGHGLDMFIGIVLKLAKPLLDQHVEAITVGDGRRIHINLAKIPQAKQLVVTVSLDSINVAADGVKVGLRVKSC